MTDRPAVAAAVAKSCAEQGIPAQMVDPIILARLAAGLAPRRPVRKRRAA